jgi:hypothetical protein
MYVRRGNVKVACSSHGGDVQMACSSHGGDVQMAGSSHGGDGSMNIFNWLICGSDTARKT